MENKRRINIMHTVLSLEVGGLEKIVYELVLGLDKDLYNVEVCCLDELGEFAYRLMQHNISVTLLRRNQKHYDALYPIRLRKLLREKDIDILHAHSGSFFLATQAGILSRTRAIIYTDHGRHLVEPEILLYMDRFSAHFAKKIIAVSGELEEYLIEKVRLPANKLTTIINGINTNSYKYREKSLSLLSELRIPDDYNIVGTVGRLVEVKDQTTIINAFCRVAKKYPNTILLLVGDGPLRAKLENVAIELNAINNIRFVGNRNDVPDLLNLMDVFMLTSLSEGTSVSLLEAMASGVPPVVTNIGGNPFIVKDGENGILVNPGDVVETTNSINYLMGNDTARKKMGQNASETVKQYYGLDKMIDKYVCIYQNSISK